MKKKNKILLGAAMTTPFLLIGLILNTNQYDTYEKLTKQGTQIAMYVEGDDGNYQLSDANQFPTDGYVLNIQESSCKNGGTLSQNDSTKKIKLNVSNSDSCTLYFAKESFIPKTVKAILNNKTVTGINSGNPTFANAATTDEGVYAMADDYGTSYYYRGAVENNYVQFANKYWRIIRVNGDGSLRMIYDGEQAYANGVNDEGRVALTEAAFSKKYNDTKYAGYMYNPEGDTLSTSYDEATTNTVSSDIKTKVDEWYKTNIVDAGYNKYVSDEIFCNDRSISETPGTWWTGEGTDIGYRRNPTAYGAFSRFLTTSSEASSTPEPKFTCTNKNDAFTVSDTIKGNGALTYPVGLVTADEIVTAGSGKSETSNSNYYLYKGLKYWSFSPRCFAGVPSIFVFNIDKLSFERSALTSAIVPVINLSAEYTSKMTGTGTATNPYICENCTAANLITFTIDGETYNAEENMTWQEWVDSAYSAKEWYVSDGHIIKQNNYFIYYESPNIKIIAGNSYETYYASQGGAN